MPVFGLTGGIASGKSTVSRLFREAGIAVVDADEVSREVVGKDSPGLERLVQAFGPTILLPDRTLHRKKLGEIIFGNPDLRQTLNAIIHPLVAERSQFLIGQCLKTHALVCYDAALLVENGLADVFRPLVVVVCDVAQQIARIKERDHLSDDDAKARVLAQSTVETKLRAANIVLWNNGTLAELKEKTQLVILQIREMFSLHS